MMAQLMEISRLLQSVSNDQLLVLYFGYDPNFEGAVLGTIMFGLVTIWSVAATGRSKFYLMNFVTLVAFLEFVGYLLRSLMIVSFSSNEYIFMSLCLILSPNLLALYNYLVVGRYIEYQSQNRHDDEVAAVIAQREKEGPKFYIPIIQDGKSGLYQAKWISRFFFVFDLISLVLQGSAGGMLTSTDPATNNQGVQLMVIALAVQFGFFAIFGLVAYNSSVSPFYCNGPLKEAEQAEVFRCLFTTILLLTGRNLYRLIEFTQGLHGDLAVHEAFLYVFDFSLILLTIVTYCYLPVGRYFAEPTVSPLNVLVIKAKKAVSKDTLLPQVDENV